MRLPLLVSASPSIKKTPLVLLREGSWAAEANVKDTKLSVMIILNENDECRTIGLGEIIELNRSGKARVIVEKSGTEQSISVDIVRIEG